ncbi:hypothetical protein Golob_024663, partial [Gossypium lobatum]|nr:hypothetical protein [Gossypium lobatum]
KLDKAKQELKSKDGALRKSVENFHNLEDKAEGKDQLCKAKEEKLNELENQLSSKRQSYNNLVFYPFTLFCLQIDPMQVVKLEHKLKEHVPLLWPSLLHTEG